MVPRRVRRLPAIVPAVLLAAVVTAALPAQAPTPAPTPAPARSDCQSCNGEGKLPCKAHGKPGLDKELAVQFCSVAAECKTCGGALAVDCRSCRNEAAETELARRQQLAKETLAKRRKEVDEVTHNVPLLHLSTGHLDLVFSIRPLTIGRDKIETHPLMHIYGERIEALRSLFLRTLAIDTRDLPKPPPPPGGGVPQPLPPLQAAASLPPLETKDLPGRLKLYMFRDAQDHTVLGPRVTGMGGGSSTGTKLMGADCVYSMWQDLRAMPDDEALWRTIVHNTTHLMLSNLTPSIWIGNRKSGWVDEGLAHWFEDKVTGRCMNFCFEEVNTQPGLTWKGGHWRAPVRKMVDEGKCRPFTDICQLNTDQLELSDHAQVFACVDFLLTAHGGAKFRDLVRLLKQDKPTRDALQQVYGLNPLTFDVQFQAWVKEHYSPLDPR